MREIEIKARVADKESLLEKLKEKHVKLSEPIVQHDLVWGVEGAQGGDQSPWLRIRTQTSGQTVKRLFTLKKSVTNQMDSIEHETEITNEAEMAHIIRHLGFTPYSDSTKTRQTAHVEDVEICLDTVEGLGDFVEVEKLTNENADYDAVAEELWKVLEEFGVSRDDHVTDGYDVLIRKKQGLEI